MSNNSVLAENVIIEVAEEIGSRTIGNQIQTGTNTTVTFDGCEDVGSDDMAFNMPYQQSSRKGTIVYSPNVITPGQSVSIPGMGTPTHQVTPIDNLITLKLEKTVGISPNFITVPTTTGFVYQAYNNQDDYSNMQGRSLYFEDKSSPKIETLCAEIVDRQSTSRLLLKGNGQDSPVLSNQFDTLVNFPEKYSWYTSAYQHSGYWNSKNSGFRWSTRRGSDILSYEGEKHQGTYRVNPNFNDSGKLGLRSSDFNQGLSYWELTIDVASLTNAKINIFTDTPTNVNIPNYPNNILDTITSPGVYTFCIPKLLSSDDWGSGANGDVLMNGASFDCFNNSVTLLQARMVNPGSATNANNGSLVINNIQLKKMEGSFITTTTPIYSSTANFTIPEYSWDKLDLFNNATTPLSLNFVSSDLRKLGSTSAGYSKTFELPNNSDNQSILTPLLAVGSVRQEGDIEWMKCRVKSNDIYVFSGYLRVEKGSTGSGGSFSCHIVEDKVNWVEEIGDKSLCDLAFPMVTKNYQNVVDSWQYNSDDADCMFGLINYGSWSGATSQTFTYDKGLSDFHPNLFTKRVVDKIFNSSGYSIESNFLNTPFFKSLVNPYTSGEDYTDGNPLGEDGNNYAEAIRAVKFAPFPNNGKMPAAGFGAWTNISSYINYTVETSDVNNNYTAGSTSSFGYTVPFTGDYQLLASARLYLSQSSLAFLNANLILRIMKNGSLLSMTQPNGNLAQIQANTNSSDLGITVDIDDVFTLNAGDVISVQVYGGNNSTIYAAWADVSDAHFHAYPIPSATTPASDIILNKVLPCEKQIDFLRGLTEMYNLQWTVDEEKKIVYTEPYDDFYGSGKVVDWTDKLDHKNWTDQFVINDLAKEIYYSYKDDGNDKIMDRINTYRGTELWSLHITNQERFKKNIVDLGTTIFSPTASFNNNGDHSFNGMWSGNPTIPLMWSGDCSGSWLHSEDRPDRNYNYNLRILNYYGVSNSVNSWNFIDESGVVHTHNEYPYLGTLKTETSYITPDASCLSWSDEVDNLITSNGLFSKYWANYFNKINGGSALRTCNLNLTPLDIALFDYRDLIHLEIDGVATYWTVHKIIDYKPNDSQLTKVELIEYKQGLNYSRNLPGTNQGGISQSTIITDTGLVSQSSGLGFLLNNNTNNRSRETGIAFGNSVIASDNQTVIGNYNKEDSQDILQVGSGSNNKNRTTALSVNNEGEVQIHGGEIVSEETSGLYSSLVYTDDEGNIKKIYLKK